MSRTQSLQLPSGKRAALRAVVDDAVRRRQAGQPISEEELCAAHPALMPELARQLRLLSVLRQAAEESRGARAAASPCPRPDFAAVERIPGYELRGEVHRGGQGVVYEALQLSTARRVAIKVTREGPFAGPADRSRFEREVHVLAQFRHPNIVAIHDSGRIEGHDYFVMDFVDGVPLDRYVQTGEKSKSPALSSSKGRKVEIKEWLRLFVKVCDAVNAAHLRGIMHRDLKPGNVLVDAAGEPRVLDFGLARFADGEAGEDVADKTATGQFVGSLPWSSPEQVDGQAVDLRSDVYSLGVMLYQCLTGRFPYSVTGRPSEVIERVRSQVPTRPRMLCPELDADVETLVLKCLAKPRERRYQSAGELAADVRRYLAGEPIEARRDSALYLLRKTVRRFRVPLAALGSFVLLLGGSSIVAWSMYGKAEEARAEATLRLWQSYLDQVRLNRRSRMAGQRLESLALVEKAARIRPSLELRDEAIAALALTDVRWHPPFATVPPSWGLPDAALDKCPIVDKAGGVRIISTFDGRELGRLPETDGVARWPLLSPDGRFLATQHTDRDEEERCKIWRLSDSRMTLEIAGLPDDRYQFSPDSRMLALGRSGGSVQIYDVETGAVRHELKVAPNLNQVRLDPGGSRVAVSGQDSGTVEIYELASGERATVLSNSQAVFDVAWHPEGNLLACGGRDVQIDIWEVAQGRHEGALSGHTGSVVELRFSHDGHRLASWSWDGTSRLWDVRTRAELLRAAGEFRAFRRDDKQLFHAVSASGGAFALRLADIVEPVGFAALLGSRPGQAAKRDACFSPDGRLVLSASLNAEQGSGLGVFDTAMREEIAFLDIGDTRCVLFDPRGSSFFSSGQHGFCRWPLQRRGEVLHIGPPIRLTDDAGRFDFAPNGRTCAILGGIGNWRLTILDVENPTDRTMFECQFGVAYLDVSAGGRWAAVGTWNGRNVEVWDLPARRHVYSYATVGTASVAFSPDERFLVVDNDGLVVIETSSWSQRLRVPGSVHRIHFSPDGRILAAHETYGADPSIRLWDATTFEPIAGLEPPDARAAGDLAFSADGSLLAVPTVDAHVVHVWDLRALRVELARLGLDWNQPPYPLAVPVDAAPLRVEIDLGELDPSLMTPQ